MSNVNLWVKQTRAQVIARHVRQLGQNKVVCFTCGTAATELRRVGLEVIGVGPNEDLVPTRWFSYTEVAAAFPGVFDATSGHLPAPLMWEVAQCLQNELPVYNGPLVIPTGSGETLACLSMAYPVLQFKAVRDTSPHTESHPEAPLNALVEALTRAAQG